MLGHDVKHCASHFAIIQNGGKVDYQYGDSLRAMGGCPRSFSQRNTSDIAGAAREQVLGESTGNSPRVVASPAAGSENTNPSMLIEICYKIFGGVPIFQEDDNVDKERHDYVQDENSSRKAPGSVM